MKKVILLLVIIVSVSTVQAQDTARKAWITGAIRVIADNNQAGQGYLVQERNVLKIFTIYHVVEGANRVTFHFHSDARQNPIEIRRSELECDTRDNDPSCYWEIPAALKQEFLSNPYIVPYHRLRRHPNLSWEQLAGSPRPDTGKWTVYWVEEVQDGSVKVEGRFPFDEDRDGVVDSSLHIGNFCRGRSGAPLVLVTYSGGNTTPILKDSRPISVGELREGVPGTEMEDIHSTNLCYSQLWANRPE